jgi:hypothetical protein
LAQRVIADALKSSLISSIVRNWVRSSDTLLHVRERDDRQEVRRNDFEKMIIRPLGRIGELKNDYLFDVIGN